MVPSLSPISGKCVMGVTGLYDTVLNCSDLGLWDSSPSAFDVVIIILLTMTTGFSCCRSFAWNSVPQHVTSSSSLDVFNRHFNTVIGMQEVITVPHQIIWSRYTGRWWVDCYILYSEDVWAGPQPAQAPYRCTKCNTPPINGQCTCTNHRIAV